MNHWFILDKYSDDVMMDRGVIALIQKCRYWIKNDEVPLESIVRVLCPSLLLVAY